VSAPAKAGLAGVLEWLPWRLRSRNNLMMATANWFFEGARKTPPMPVPGQADVEIHSLVCHRDVNMMLTSAKSLLRYLPEAALVLHDDGSITEADRDLFERHLPGSQIIGRSEADDEMRKLLPADVFAARAKYFFLLKLFDFNHFNRGRKTILLDSDIVFLAPPTEIVEWARTPGAAPFYNEDWCPSYRAKSVPAGIVLPPKLNAGFMGFDGRFSLHQIWDCCRSVDYWLEDQTIYALLLAGRDARALDAQRYRVYTGGQVALNTPMVHFISPNRFTTLLYPRLARRVHLSLRSQG
jgi:hypothetical protein